MDYGDPVAEVISVLLMQAESGESPAESTMGTAAYMVHETS